MGLSLEDIEQRTNQEGYLLEETPAYISAPAKGIINILNGVADFFGVGGAIKNLLKGWGANMPTTSEVQAIIKKIVANAKIKSEQQLSKISNMLSALPQAYSQVAKKAINSARTKLLSQQQQLIASSSKAGQVEDSANMMAYDVDSSGWANAYGKARDAINQAKEAAKLYETTVLDTTTTE